MTNLNDIPIQNLAREIHKTAVEKGFWDKVITVDAKSAVGPEYLYDDDIDFYLSKLALIHSEISETLEAMRKPALNDTIAEELADIFIRLLDFYAGCQKSFWIKPTPFDIVIDIKMAKNKVRPPRHGNLA